MEEPVNLNIDLYWMDTFIDNLLKQGVTNFSVCYERIKYHGYAGSLSTVKRYISTYKYLLPAKRHLVQP